MIEHRFTNPTRLPRGLFKAILSYALLALTENKIKLFRFAVSEFYFIFISYLEQLLV
jgi:hypothetical protein